MESLYISPTNSVGKIRLFMYPRGVEYACLSVGAVVFQIFANSVVKQIQSIRLISSLCVCIQSCAHVYHSQDIECVYHQEKLPCVF